MTGLVKSSRVLLPLLADQRHQRLPTELVNTRTDDSQRHQRLPTELVNTRTEDSQRHQRLPTELVNTRTEVSQLLHSSSLLRSEDFSVKKEQFLSQFTPMGELDANRVKKEP